MNTLLPASHMYKTRPFRSSLTRALAIATLIGTAVLIPTAAASASTAVTLYVSGSGTSVAGCTSPGAAACETVQQAVSAAELYASAAVTINVAPGTYNEHDTINVPASDTLTIQGSAAKTTVLNAKSGGSTFTVLAGTVTIAGLTITGGHALTGAGVNDAAGSLTLLGDTISANKAVSTSCTAAAKGAGVYSSAALVMSGDTIASNTANGGCGSASGAGVYATSTINLTNDTFSTNVASATTADGGAIASTGTLAVLDSTLSNNTVSGTHTAGGGIRSTGASASIADSIISASSCSGVITDGGHNVESGNTCGLGSTNTVNSASIHLTALAANGSTGPQTMAISTNSSAYKEVPTASCSVATDERGFPRPGIATQYCDAGAYEYQHLVAPSTPVITNVPATAILGSSFTAIVSTNSNGQTSVSSATTTVCTTSVLTVTYRSVGICTLFANVAQSASYYLATGGPQSFNVSPVPVTTTTRAPRVPQAPLLITNKVISVPWYATVVITTKGGSGTGAVRFNRLSGNCYLRGSHLIANAKAACTVVATKAGTTHYIPRHSAQATFYFGFKAEKALWVYSSSSVKSHTSRTTLYTSGGSGTGAVHYTTTGRYCTVVQNYLYASKATTCYVMAHKAFAETYLPVASGVIKVRFT